MEGGRLYRFEPDELVDRIALVLADYFYGSTDITSGGVLEAARQVVKLFEPVPWCDEHDCPFYSVARFHADGNDCRLKKPARHYRIKGGEDQ